MFKLDRDDGNPAFSEPLPFFTSQLSEIIFILVTLSWPFGELRLPGGLPCFSLPPALLSGAV
jgi:hypothetical protein